MVRTDEFGMPIVTTGGSRTSNFGIGLPTYAPATVSPDINNPLRTGGMGVAGTRLSDPYQFDTFPGDTTDTTDTTGLPGSPLKTLYGVDSESYLTDDQRKLARQIQGKFDQSAGFRDRELNRYGAPRLASFTEDEALARAMSLARGLNTPETTDTTLTPPPIRQGNVPTPRPPAATPPPPPTVPRDRYAEWAKVLTGLTSIAGLLFGRDGFGNFINKGAIKSVMDWYKGITGTDASPEQMQQMIGGGNVPAYPTQAATDWWNQNMSPWGASAEGGGLYPTQAASDWWNVPGSEAITMPLTTGDTPIGIPDFTDPWWGWS